MDISSLRRRPPVAHLGPAVLVAALPVLFRAGSASAETAGALAGAVHLAFVLALLIALRRFPLAATGRRDRGRAAVDATIVLAGASTVLWYTALGPSVQRHGLSAPVLLAAGFVVADLAVLYGVTRFLLRGTGGPSSRPLRLAATGLLVLTAGDAVLGALPSSAAWQSACWVTAGALLAAAAVAQSHAAPARVRAPAGFAPRSLASISVGVANAVVLAAVVRGGSFFPWGGLALGGAALSALLLARQTLMQRESDERAVTDALTGLADRARFRATAERSLARDARTGRYSAVLVIGMNEFKAVNDTLGYDAGDLVLIAFAGLLRAGVPAPGLPARLGGDEFAVVLTGLAHPAQAYEIAGRIAAATAPIVIAGRLVTPAAGIGVAVTAPGELTHDEIVHRAGVAMDRAKRNGPQTRWAAWQESYEADADTHHLAA